MGQARLNFSHGEARDHREFAEVVREAARTVGSEVLLMQDLQGPKLRIGRVGHPIHFRKDDKVSLTRQPEQSNDIPVAMPEILDQIRVGDRIFLDDGAVELEAIEIRAAGIVCIVRIGGRVDSGSGIQLPDNPISLPALSRKDVEDVQAGLRMGVDLVAQSMVRSRADVDQLVGHVKGSARIVAKIENPEALGDLNGIAGAVWGIMVARGDLGVSIPRAQVPLWQKEILRTCHARGRFGIVATEMLISMVKNDRPSRAEVSDVATAVLDGADAVMLSEETAIGAHPVEAVQEMREIIETIEDSDWYRRIKGPPE